eukprot:s735_g11.t1
MLPMAFHNSIANTPRSPAAMLRQCEMEHEAVICFPWLSTTALPPGVWEFFAVRAMSIGGKSAGSHGCEATAATWYFLYIAAETEEGSGARSAASVFSLKVGQVQKPQKMVKQERQRAVAVEQLTEVRKSLITSHLEYLQAIGFIKANVQVTSSEMNLPLFFDSLNYLFQAGVKGEGSELEEPGCYARVMAASTLEVRCGAQEPAKEAIGDDQAAGESVKEDRGSTHKLREQKPQN